ncbi:uncharacterized protein LTHEOB_12436 [Neofusicoccum parvum]|nr:uncharacterized protein LTHEOB_12436 [Neofusicoccum parvum]
MAYHDSDCSSDSGRSNDEFLSTSDPERSQPSRPQTRPFTFKRLKLLATRPQRPPHPSTKRRCWPTKRRWRIILVILIIIGIIATCLYLTWLSLVAALLTRLSPPTPAPAGVRTLLTTWRTPADSAPSATWLTSFSAGIQPVRCHSHNDYWRPVPLFTALAAGCASVEADVWLPGNNANANASLLVGHERRSLDGARTLAALYVAPLVAVLEEANRANGSAAAAAGVFEESPETTVVLLLDFKEGDARVWEGVQRDLEPLRERGWLTYWDGANATRVVRPVTVVATGDAPFEVIEGLAVKDVFYDAPLEKLGDDGKYTAENSYYASVEMKKGVGKVGWHGLSGGQAETVQKQCDVAAEKGLVSRYWGTPSWPVALRNGVWDTLVGNGVGVLNVDELTTATRWDWRFCTVLGLTICK